MIKLASILTEANAEESPFAVFVLARAGDGYAATTRPVGSSDAGKIGLPGGKVDPGETPLEAVKRECTEEGWDVEIINHKPIHKQIVNGKLIWWYRGVNPKMLSTYKEMHRLSPVIVTREQIINAGKGNENLGI